MTEDEEGSPQSPLLEKVLGFLEKFAWSPESVEESEGQYTVTLLAQLDIKEIKILIKFSEESRWLYFSTMFLSKIETNHYEVYQKLLEINYSTTLTKFGLSPNHNVYALIELPSETLDYEEFLSALRRLTNDVNSYILPIANLLRKAEG
ncbi:MAG: YbjN domain-containing protein [Candidatus Kariarchaeaceae archaeon]